MFRLYPLDEVMAREAHNPASLFVTAAVDHVL
jgi:hypothetical protein